MSNNWVPVALVVVLALMPVFAIQYHWFRRRPKPHEPVRVIDENGEEMPDGPLRRAIDRSWRTGETVIWNEGDPLP